MPSFRPLLNVDLPWLARFREQFGKLRGGWHPHSTQLQDGRGLRMGVMGGRQRENWIFWRGRRPVGLYLHFIYFSLRQIDTWVPIWFILTGCFARALSEIPHPTCLSPNSLCVCECVCVCTITWIACNDEALMMWVSELQQPCFRPAAADRN